MYIFKYVHVFGVYNFYSFTACNVYLSTSVELVALALATFAPVYLAGIQFYQKQFLPS